MRADLHVHSVFSDGHYTPEEIAKRAKKAGVELLSITDHDTLNGGAEKRAAAKKYGVNYLSGWEISAYEGEQKLHVLGYGCSETNSAYLAFTQKRVQASYERVYDSVQKMRGAGIDISAEQVFDQREDPSAPVHSMHIARVIGKVVGISETEAYVKYLAPTRIAHSGVGRPTPQEAIECIKQSGGFAVLAHPGRIWMDFEEREKTILRLVEMGLKGIEATYTTHTKQETEYFLSLAKKCGLLCTGGSDVHFEEETHKIGFPVFETSEELLKELMAKNRLT
ncbi:MAG: PHP domain-containing protein [Clostridia bacterium]|nr:PHP domain-containing protein [Clostridia bacterium]